MEHEVNETFPTEHITRELIDATLPQFVGDIEQIPPTYSAVKVMVSVLSTIEEKVKM